MKFIKEITIDWYDNILKSFCFDEDDNVYYCCILAQDSETNQKIYLCINIRDLQGYNQLKSIIKSNSFKENWDKLADLVFLKKQNKTYLIKTTDLRNDSINLIKYKENVTIPKNLLWGEYPEVLEEAEKFDNWWVVYQLGCF